MSKPQAMPWEPDAGENTSGAQKNFPSPDAEARLRRLDAERAADVRDAEMEAELRACWDRAWARGDSKEVAVCFAALVEITGRRRQREIEKAKRYWERHAS